MGAVLLACMCVDHVHAEPVVPEEVTDDLELMEPVTGGHESPCGCWDSNKALSKGGQCS